MLSTCHVPITLTAPQVVRLRHQWFTVQLPLPAGTNSHLVLSPHWLLPTALQPGQRCRVKEAVSSAHPVLPQWRPGVAVCLTGQRSLGCGLAESTDPFCPKFPTKKQASVSTGTACQPRGCVCRGLGAQWNRFLNPLCFFILHVFSFCGEENPRNQLPPGGIGIRQGDQDGKVRAHGAHLPHRHIKNTPACGKVLTED